MPQQHLHYIALYLIDGCTTLPTSHLGKTITATAIFLTEQLAVNVVDEIYFVFVRHPVIFVICILQVQE